MASKPGIVTDVSANAITIDDVVYTLQTQGGDIVQTEVRLGIFHNADEDFTPFPTSSFWQEPQVQKGDIVSKGQLLAKGFTHIYFQANKWIFFSLVFILGIMMGIGTAAVYKHISDYYPSSIGTVGGIVGGFLLEGTGVWTTCWMYLAVIAIICIIFQRIAIKKANLTPHQK